MGKTYVDGREVKNWLLDGRELQRVLLDGREVFKKGGGGTHRMVAALVSQGGSAYTYYGFHNLYPDKGIMEPQMVGGYRIGGLTSIHNQYGYHMFEFFAIREGAGGLLQADRVFPWTKVILDIVGIDGRTGVHGKTTLELTKKGTYPMGCWGYALTYTMYPPDYNVNSPQWYHFIPGEEYWLTFTLI